MAAEETGLSTFSKSADGSVTRKLASIQRVVSLSPIDGADAIVLGRILGWKVVCPKGDFVEGDLCVYFEIDSCVIAHPVFVKLQSSGYKVKTRKFRGQISQGFCLPVSILDDVTVQMAEVDGFPLPGPDVSKPEIVEGADVTRWLRVMKIEDFQVDVGDHEPFPSLIPKTDEIRIQTMPDYLLSIQGQSAYVTEKVDGQSCTLFSLGGNFGVCTRNFKIKDQPGQKDNRIWDFVNAEKLREKVTALGRDIAIQGEFVGPAVACNRLNLSSHRILIFRVFDVSSGQFLGLDEMESVAKAVELPTVPVLERNFIVTHTLDDLVEYSSAKTRVKPELKGTSPAWREGIVCILHDSRPDAPRSFKVINPQFLLKFDL